MPSWWIVASSWFVIWNPPSPTIAQIVSSGCAIAAPIAAGTAKPIVPAPPLVMCVRGTLPLDQLRGPHLVLADIADDPIPAPGSQSTIDRRVDVVRHQLRG